MSDTIVAAEIITTPGQASRAAKALQQLGFRVLRVDSSISVQAPEKVWESTFHISFKKQRKQRLAGIEKSSVKYALPIEGTVTIPPSLSELIADVHFVQPPEFF
jgi:hypothetical protein